MAGMVSGTGVARRVGLPHALAFGDKKQMHCCNVDFFLILRDLRHEAGLSIRIVARRIHVPWSTLKGIYAQGYEPRYSTGEKLVNFYRKTLNREPPRYNCGE